MVLPRSPNSAAVPVIALMRTGAAAADVVAELGDGGRDLPSKNAAASSHDAEYLKQTKSRITCRPLV